MKCKRGVLATPIVRQDKSARVWLGFSEELRTRIFSDNHARRVRVDNASVTAIKREERRIAKLVSEKLALLAEHYGALRNGRPNWRVLATKLAQEMVPGLRVIDETPKRGRPRTQHRSLYHDVLAKQRKRKRTLPEVLKSLTLRGEPYAGAEIESLKTRFYRERKQWEANASRLRRQEKKK